MLLARFLGIRRLVTVGLIAIAVSAAPVRAERPIVDLHRLDAYFELFAADSSVPWRPTTVRLDTYSSAPVAFSVYQVDPADVLTAGSNFSPRAILTAHRRADASFTFSPPGGYQFQSNEVSVPLGSREGFFVVEARRGNVGEQVWINRSRIGLVVKETPGGLLLYGADLGTGEPLAHMRVQFVVNRSFATMLTDSQGIVRWNRAARPVFALAQWAGSYAFLNLLPQAPLPATIVGVRTESAVVHAGGTLRVVGFARTRVRGVLRASSGTAIVSLRNGPAAIAELRVPLDAAGAFAATFTIPENATAGQYSVLAQAAGGVGGATVDVDANAPGLSLQVTAACGGGFCDSRRDVPLLIHSSRGGVTVRVAVVRSPHVYLGDAPASAPWATAPWFDAMVRTGDDGNATVDVPHPDDQLGSTYGVRVEADGATAGTRVTVPTAEAAVRLVVDRSEQGIGAPLGFDVYAELLDGRPLANASVTVDMVHGASVARQQLTFDAGGHARGSFNAPDLGTNFLFATVDRGGRAMDAAQVRVDPQASGISTAGDSPNVHVRLDRKSYHADEEVTVDAQGDGSRGQALITFESAQGIEARVVRVSGASAVARLRAANAAGDLRVGAAFVRDGSIEWTTIPVELSAPGRPQFAALALGGDEFAPGAPAHVRLDGTPGSGTFVVRVSRGVPSGSALFASAPTLLDVGVTATQNSAAGGATWHPWVNSTGEHAQVLGFVRRSGPPPELSLAQAETETLSWSVARASDGGLAIELPDRSGRYDLSVLELSDDGSVSAGSSTVTVR